MENEKINPLNHVSRLLSKHKSFFMKHKDKFWWFHSIYALFFGIGVMWLGNRNFQFISLAILQIIFIWLSSLGVPFILQYWKLDFKWKHRIRLLFNYFNRNLYQQILFFVIPVYYRSTTLDSPNVIFILLVVVSAILSTMDIVYDRFISVKGTILSLFFAFNTFICINVMLPFLWQVKNSHAVRISAVCAFLGYSTFCLRLAPVNRSKKILMIVGAAVLIFLVSEVGRSFIPPAPMRLDQAQVGTGISKESKQLSGLLDYLPAKKTRIYILTMIKAPYGHSEKVKHSWYLDGKRIYSSRYFNIVGQGNRGFRFWTYFTVKSTSPGSVLKVDLETEGGQLIGRVRLRAKESSGDIDQKF